MALETTIQIGDPFHPEDSCYVNDWPVMYGNRRLAKYSYAIQHYYKEIQGQLIGYMDVFGKRFGLERKIYDDEWFGVYRHLPENIKALFQKAQSLGGRSVSVMSMSLDFYKYTRDHPWMAKAVMLHEMLHAYYGLGEREAREMAVKFFKYMADISYGSIRRMYLKMYKLSKIILEEHADMPYEKVEIAYTELLTSLKSVQKKLKGKLSNAKRVALSKLEKKIIRALKLSKKQKAKKGKSKKGKKGTKTKGSKSKGSKGKK